MLLDLLHNDPTLAGSRPGGRTTAGVFVRLVQRILALTTAIWHNDHTGRPIKRSLLAYDQSDPMTDPELPVAVLFSRNLVHRAATDRRRRGASSWNAPDAAVGLR